MIFFKLKLDGEVEVLAIEPNFQGFVVVVE